MTGKNVENALEKMKNQFHLGGVENSLPFVISRYQQFESVRDTDSRDVCSLSYRHCEFAKGRWRRKSVYSRTLLRNARNLNGEIREAE